MKLIKKEIPLLKNLSKQKLNSYQQKILPNLNNNFKFEDFIFNSQEKSNKEKKKSNNIQSINHIFKYHIAKYRENVRKKESTV
jgi:hypothetical protein